MGIRERRARQKSLLRQEILDAARDILIRDGYAGLSMRKVAQKIDYSPTTIYLHFQDRDDLVFHVCEQLMAGLVAELRDVVRQYPDPLVALRKGLARYVHFGLAHPEHYIATFGVPHGDDPRVAERHQAADSMSMQAFGFLPRLVGECVRLKKIRKVDVAATSRALWAAAHGITSLLIVMPDFDWGHKETLVETMVETLYEGLKPPRTVRARAT